MSLKEIDNPSPKVMKASVTGRKISEKIVEDINIYKMIDESNNFLLRIKDRHLSEKILPG